MKTGSKALERRIKQHVLAKEHDLFAIVQPGFEEEARLEMEERGIKNITGITEGGIEFTSRLEECYRLNLCSHTVNRVIMRLFGFRTDSFDRVYQKVAAFPWELYLKHNYMLEFSISSRKSKLYHTGKLEKEFRRAVTDRLTRYEKALSASPEDGGTIPVQTVYIRFYHERCRVSLDSSGEALYKRGYREHVSKAPLRETLAALILKSARYNKYDMLIDPMCGSGTFSLEAAMMELGMLPGGNRAFAFQEWPVYRERAFHYLKKTIIEKKMISLRGNPMQILCSDIDGKMVEAARRNFQQAGIAKYVNPAVMDFFKAIIPVPLNKKSLLIINPPYGKRSGEENHMGAFYRQLGNKIRGEYAGSGYAIIVPHLDLEKILSLPYDRKILFMNGGIRVALIIKDRY